MVSNFSSIHKYGGNGHKKKYHPSIGKLFEVVHNFVRASTHNFLSSILLGLVMNTSQLYTYKSEGFLYTIGLNDESFIHLSLILIECKAKIKILDPILFE